MLGCGWSGDWRGWKLAAGDWAGWLCGSHTDKLNLTPVSKRRNSSLASRCNLFLF